MTAGMILGVVGDDGSFAEAVGGSTWVLVALSPVGTSLTWVFVRDPERPGPDPSRGWRTAA